jgi:hypothetical protein
MSASTKKSPRKLNLYISEEVQAAAQTLAEGRSLSLSQLVTELIQESFERLHSNERSDEWEMLNDATGELVKRLGGKLEQRDFGELLITIAGKRIGVEFESNAFRRSQGAKLLQDLAFRRAKDRLNGYLTILPDRASPEMIKGYERLARESIYVPMMVAKIKDLEVTLKAFCEKKEIRTGRKLQMLAKTKFQ